MTENSNANPLQKYYRQPAIYIKLPSEGRYYTKDVYTPTETGEIPVLPMTAKDELAFKTPDALMNGQATVDVIKSCVPNLLDPWSMVAYDTDAVLLAIRIATYGETMDIKYQVPVTLEDQEHTINLPSLLEQVNTLKIDDYTTTSKGFKIKVAPLTYRQVAKVQLARFEQQKMIGTVNDSTLSEEQKQTAFSKSWGIMNTVNFGLLVDAIGEITTPDGEVVTDRKQIAEFCNKADTRTVKEIEQKIQSLKTQAQTPPLKIKATEEQIKKGVPATYNVPITFDQSNFFG
jgi:hypothetical protein